MFPVNTTQLDVSCHKRYSVPPVDVSLSICRASLIGKIDKLLILDTTILGGFGWGWEVSPLSIVVNLRISRSVFEARENTLKSLVVVQGHLKHWQFLHHVLSYSSPQALKVFFYCSYSTYNTTLNTYPTYNTTLNTYTTYNTTLNTYSTYNTIQYNTIQYNTVRNNTILTLFTMLNLYKYKDTLTLHLKQCNNVHYYYCN